MDIDQALETLETLATGVHPATGEVMAPDSPYNHPDVIRALFVCVRQLRQPAPRAGRRRSAEDRQADNLQRGLPKNAGIRWSDEDRAALAERFEAGETPAQLAEAFERTQNSILAELSRQGLISQDEARGSFRGA